MTADQTAPTSQPTASEPVAVPGLAEVLAAHVFMPTDWKDDDLCMCGQPFRRTGATAAWSEHAAAAVAAHLTAALAQPELREAVTRSIAAADHRAGERTTWESVWRHYANAALAAVAAHLTGEADHV